MKPKTQDDPGPRPADLHPEAVWPLRVKFDNAPITVTDTSVIRKAPVPEGGFGVRIGNVPMSGDTPRTDGTSEMPTEGPGVARRAIPAPEDAETTGTEPPPYTMHSDGRRGSEASREASPAPTTTHDAPAPQAARAPRVAKAAKKAARR